MNIGILCLTDKQGTYFKEKLKLSHQADKIFIIPNLQSFTGRSYDIIYQTPLFETSAEYERLMNYLQHKFDVNKIQKL